MTRNDACRALYRQKRYLKGAISVELQRRFRDLLANVVVLDDDGRLGVLPVLPVKSVGGFFWMRLTDCLEEYALRGWDVVVPQGRYSKLQRLVIAVEVEPIEEVWAMEIQLHCFRASGAPQSNH